MGIFSDTSVSISATDEIIRSDVFSTLLPMYHISKICGLLPVKFTRNKSGTYSGQLNYLETVYGKILAFIFFGAQCWSWHEDFRDVARTSSGTTVAANCGDVATVVCLVLVAILGSPYRWNCLQKTLDKLISVDEKLGVPMTRNLRKRIIIVMSCTYIYLVATSILDFIHMGLSFPSENKTGFALEESLNHSAIYFMYVVIITLVMQYALILFIIGERFLKLNKTIENLTNNNSISARGSLDEIIQDYVVWRDNRHFNKHRTNRVSDSAALREESGEASATIDELIILHGLLCDSIDEINKAYGSAILVGAISCLIHLTISPYYLYATIHNNSSCSRAVVVQVLWILFHLYTLLLFVQPPYMVATKGTKTKDVVSHALAGNWNRHVKKQLEIFSIQLLQRPVKFTANGLFSVDRSLLTSMASAVTTYLVILVQFQVADETEGTKNLLENATNLFRNPSLLKL